ncbi:MAG: phytanoyl-CoA dioxygenase family protein [Pseudomonadota bacterium]
MTSANTAKDGLDVQQQYALTQEQIDFFETNGYLGPIEAMSEGEMAKLRGWIDKLGFLDGPSPVYDMGKDYGHRILRDWHLVYKEMMELASLPVIVEAMASLMGPDLVLWRSQFQYKDKGGGPVAWHQDLGFPGHLFRPAIDPVKNISAWIAIDDANLSNGCVRIVPGSHRREIERRMTKVGPEDKGLFGRRYKVEYVVDTADAVALVMKPGQFFLFNESSLHGSTGNPTSKRRLGFSTRVTTPEVKIYEDQDVDGQGFPLDHYLPVLLRGEDRHGHNGIVAASELEFIES